MKKEIIITEEQKNTLDKAIAIINDIVAEMDICYGWAYMEKGYWTDATTRRDLQTTAMSLENAKHIVAVK